MEKDTLLGQGRTADIHAWGDGRILKLFQSWAPAVVAQREYSVTRGAYAAGLPVPATYELVEVEGRHGIIFERIEGISLLAELQANPSKVFAVARQLGELHAQIHAMPAPVELPSQRKQIEEGIEASKDLPQAEKQAAIKSLTQLPEGESFCHGDFHPDNILLSARGPVIIDWLTGARGHPLADVARTALLFQTGSLPPGIPAPTRLLFNLSRALLYEIYLNSYLQLRPANRLQIDRRRLPLVAARLREVENYPQEKRLLLAWLKALLKKSR